MDEEITIRVSPRLLPSLCRMWRKRSTAPLASFVAELVETEVANFRLAEIGRDVAAYGSAAAGNVTSNVWRAKLSQENIRKILNLQHTVPMSTLARRFNVGQSTIRRVIERATKNEAG